VGAEAARLVRSSDSSRRPTSRRDGCLSDSFARWEQPLRRGLRSNEKRGEARIAAPIPDRLANRQRSLRSRAASSSPKQARPPASSPIRARSRLRPHLRSQRDLNSCPLGTVSLFNPKRVSVPGSSSPNAGWTPPRHEEWLSPTSSALCCASTRVGADLCFRRCARGWSLYGGFRGCKPAATKRQIDVATEARKKAKSVANRLPPVA